MKKLQCTVCRKAMLTKTVPISSQEAVEVCKTCLKAILKWAVDESYESRTDTQETR